MREYRRRFEILASQGPGIPDHFLKSNFTNGLQMDIKAELRLIKPIALIRIMETT